MHAEPPTNAQRLFDELADLGAESRSARLQSLAADPEVAREVLSLLAASERAGDFLGVLNPPATAREWAPGSMIADRYRLTRLLGLGAMGDVYLAHDEQLARPVALKFLRASRAGVDHESVARFRAEARAAAQLDHPHVAAVFDAGKTDAGQLFIVMAYYPGETLRARLTRERLPAADALRIGAQIASALAVAHDAGIVHRDVKPANVLFDAAGGARLTDFGIAKVRADPHVTGDGIAIGTPAYMSPEQARGEPVAAATDLWALGVLLHEMLTGDRPSAGHDVAERTARVRDEFPAAHEIVRALLADDPAQRPSSALEVQRALDAMATGSEAPARRSAPQRGTMPTALTSLVGRERELVATRHLLGDTRLLTLIGPGGTGKTRLAIALAEAVRNDYADGVWFVPLAELSDPSLVASAIALALGVRDLGTSAPVDRVIGALGARELLLVLDNFEHVLAAAPLVTTMLSACPHLRVLATSRATLGVQGEQGYPVPPLRTPLPADQDAAGSEAVRLFVARARAVRPGFTLDAESLGVVAEICRRLDGLPLALELAAARARLLSPRAILTRLEQRFDLLRSDAPDRPARHGTMRAVMEWSFILLTDEERALFCRLSVFAGGAPLEAAELIAAGLSEPAPSPADVLDLVASLGSKSLIVAEEQPDGEPRFLMLETVREFGLDRLAAGGDESAARRAHRSYFVSLAERAAEQLRGPEQATWFNRLEREYANFRAALEGALVDPRAGVTDAARIAVALHRLWLTRGPLFEGIDQIERIRGALKRDGVPPLDARLQARLVSGAAQLMGTRSLFRNARDLFAEALSLYRALDDRAGVASTLNNLAWQTWNVGDLAGSDAMSREAMAIHEQLDDALGIALSRNNLAWTSAERGQFDAAQEHFDAVLASHRERGDSRAAAFVLSWLGALAEKRGDLARAIALHEQALTISGPVADAAWRTSALARLANARQALTNDEDQARLLATSYVPALRQFGRLWPLAFGLTALGTMHLERDDATAARPVLEEALACWRTTGSAAGMAETTMLLGVAFLRDGAREQSAALLADGVDRAMAYDAPPLFVAVIEAVASFALASDQMAGATVLLAAADRTRDALGMRRSPRAAATYARNRRQIAATIGDSPTVAAWTEGAALSLAEAAIRARDILRNAIER
ncbi:MAG: protein kinase [Gemmatimonadota bacterium]|nr:protein kinase [Gemmatimonadota bacterium]